MSQNLSWSQLGNPQWKINEKGVQVINKGALWVTSSHSRLGHINYLSFSLPSFPQPQPELGHQVRAV